MKWSSMEGRCGMDFSRGPENELPEGYNSFREEQKEREKRERERERERDFFFDEGPREFPVAEEEMSHDPFKVLGLKRSASDEDIKTKYRELILIHHPDKGGDHDEFLKVQQAYDFLK